MFSTSWNKFKEWLIRKLGGVWPYSCEFELWQDFSCTIQRAVGQACRKAQADPGIPTPGANLGRNSHRDEACEWAKLMLKDRGEKYSDSDVHLACELYYRLFIRQ